MILISTLYSCKRILLLSFLILLSSATLVAQVKIKEKIVLAPNNAITTHAYDTSGIIGTRKVRTLPTLQSVTDTNGTIVTVKYYYRTCEGFGIVRITDSPCTAYHDSAVGNTVTDINQQGLAEFWFRAYDRLDLKPYTIRAFPQFGPNQVIGTCFVLSNNDSIVVTDNRGTHLRSDPGYTPYVQYQPPAGSMCVDNNPQPQTFDPNSVEKYRDGEYFYPGGNNLPYIVTGCPLPWDDPHNNTLGVTFMIRYMPNNLPPRQQTWNPVNNNTLKVCLDQAQNRWHVKVQGLRIPIFSSSCIRNYTDLGDGCNPAILSSQITSIDLYKMALRDIKWWWEGPYSHPQGSHPERFAFRAGIEWHEDYHFSRDLASVVDSMSAAFQRIYDALFPYAQYPCAKNTIEGARNTVNSELTQGWNAANGRFGNNPWEIAKNISQEDKDADKNARTEYDRIRVCITIWASTQSWYQN
jgi:hypothetical protein